MCYLRNEIRIARKEHSCSHCDNKINKGDYYTFIVDIDRIENKLEQYKICDNCQEIKYKLTPEMVKGAKKRAEKINEIIKEIGSRSHRYFHKDGIFSKIEIRNRRIWWIDKYEQDRIHIHSPYKDEVNFTEGGTLWGLVNDFCHYIMTGEQSNGLNGYGGLYCPHWGYPDEDMKAIREKAVEVGYLKERY